jgi:hypothetical protein
MSRRTRKPETVKIDISQGDWILVKKHLTAGEQRQIFAGMMREQGGSAIDPLKVGVSKLAGYLLDWSFTDADDKPMVIRDQPIEAIASNLNMLDPEDFGELVRAVDSHEEAMQKVRELEKKVDGPNASGPTSISPAA